MMRVAIKQDTLRLAGIMKALYTLVLFFLAVACDDPSRGKLISAVSFPKSVYKDSFQEIEEELKRKPHSITLAEQKLVYCEELNWPESCIDALTIKRNNAGLSSQLVRQLLDYHIQNDNKERIIELIFGWDHVFHVKNDYFLPYVNALKDLEIYDSLRKELPKYLISNQSADDLLIAARTYLAMEDTLLSVYYYSKLKHQGYSPRDFKHTYPDLLILLGQPDRALQVMDSFLAYHIEDTTYAILIAELYQNNQQLREARRVLKPYMNQDTITLRVAELFKQEYLWDSAILVLDDFLELSPENKQALLIRADYYEQRGWLSHALQLYEGIIESYPSDTIARQRSVLINRKIAYLLQKRAAEEKLPVLEIQPKKLKLKDE